MKSKLDHIDFAVLKLLAENAQLPYTEVAKSIGISSGTVHARTRKMIKLGIIKGATLHLDYGKLGWNMTIFLGIHLKESALYNEVIQSLEKIPEVVNIHHSAGTYDVFAKMHAKDNIHYKNVYQNHILTIDGIKGVESSFSVEESVSRNVSLG